MKNKQEKRVSSVNAVSHISANWSK